MVINVQFELAVMIVNKLITNGETRDDNNILVTLTEKCEANHIKHCEINTAADSRKEQNW